jgi:putative membrane protein insertion efficiency factor
VSAVPGPALHAAPPARVAAQLQVVRVFRALRRGLWLLGTPARLVLIGLVRLYRASLSGWLGGQCRFHPTCSHYAEDAIRGVGAVRGSALAVWRVLRCGPFDTGGFDPAPGSGPRSGLEYDNAIHGRDEDDR